jgi:hypothetical protein
MARSMLTPPRHPGPLACVLALLGVSLASAADAPPPTFPGPPVTVTAIAIPAFPGASAIWGALGCDARNHIWVAVTADRVPTPSAHLFEFLPETNQLLPRSDVVAELQHAGLDRPGQQQMKIHSHIVPASDGYLYFASMDEKGERDDGSQPPTWGGHLWRLRPADSKWEHLLATPHALIAVAAGSHYVYALGYFGHVLYQYDTKTGQTNHVAVGSIAGHVSRNFLVDDRGHAFVPRVEYDPALGPKPKLRSWHASLIEYDPQLREIAATPLPHYGQGNPTLSHGIVAFQSLPDRSVAFITHEGFLYLIQPPASDGPATIKPIGYFDPADPAYVAALNLSSDQTKLQGLCRLHSDLYPHQAYQWITFDLTTGCRIVQPLALTNADPKILEDALLYGSSTRDPAGRVYVGGTILHQGKPLLLQIEP